MTNKLMLAAVFALASSVSTFAQTSQAGFDSRWNPYLGCWTISQEQIGNQPVALAPGTMVCVRPEGRFGIAVTTTVDGKNVLEQTIVADGSAQPLSQGDCHGTQTSEWSRDGERLFTRVALECAGRPARTVTGITMMAKGRWVDVQATEVDGDHDLRIRRYRRSSDEYTGMPAMTAAPFNVEDVIEASAKVQSPAVEAALVEVGGRFALSSRVLKQLADAKVSPNVIDLMVAQAYPNRFDIDSGLYPPMPIPTPTTSSAASSSGGSTTVVMGSTIYPYPYYDPFYNSYYYYSPFAYPYYWGAGYHYRYGYPYYRSYYGNNYYYGYYPPYYYGGGGSINPPDVDRPGTPDSRGGSGIATGRGYTRVRPAGSGDGGGDGAVPAGRSGSVGGTRGVNGGSSSGSSGTSNTGSSNSGSSNSGSSNSGGASGGGYSGGGSVGGGGRTAQPR